MHFSFMLYNTSCHPPTSVAIFIMAPVSSKWGCAVAVIPGGSKENFCPMLRVDMSNSYLVDFGSEQPHW